MSLIPSQKVDSARARRYRRSSIKPERNLRNTRTIVASSFCTIVAPLTEALKPAWFCPRCLASIGTNDPYDEGRVVNEPERFRFSGKSKLTASRNTSISAVVVLQHYCVDERMVSIINELLFRQRRGELIAPGANIQLLSERQDEPREISHEGTVRVIVLENPYARYRFPADLFRGPFDQRWTFADGCYSMTWIGSELKRLVNRPSPVPFILL